MALIKRIARLFHADMNAVLDKIEEPEVLLKQSLREMQSLLDADERQIQLSKIELKQLKSKGRDLSEALEDIEDQLTICFKSNKDDLVRTLIKKKLVAEQSEVFLLRKQQRLEDSIEQLKINLKEQQSLFERMQQKAELFSQPDEVYVSNEWDVQSNNINEDDVEIAFLHEKDKWSAS